MCLLSFHNLSLGLSEKTVDVISRFLGEVIGTGMLMLLGCSSGMAWKNQPADFVGGLTFGLVVMMIIQCFGEISGAHLNPAVTLCAVLNKMMSIPVRGLIYLCWNQMYLTCYLTIDGNRLRHRPNPWRLCWFRPTRGAHTDAHLSTGSGRNGGHLQHGASRRVERSSDVFLGVLVHDGADHFVLFIMGSEKCDQTRLSGVEVWLCCCCSVNCCGEFSQTLLQRTHLLFTQIIYSWKPIWSRFTLTFSKLST